MEELTLASDQSNKKNLPPFSTKTLIPAVAPSFKNMLRRRLNITRIPLADITDLFIHSASQNGLSEIPLSILPPSNPRRNTKPIPYSTHRICSSKSLSMGFR